MPARRSRTLNWKDSLRRICERNGPIEITIDHGLPDDAARAPHVIWRVRLLDVGEDELVIEEPTALDIPVTLRDGARLIAIMAVGQNRWMFHTEVLGRTEHALNTRKSVGAYRLSMPDQVERCQRRNFYRVSTASLLLPPVHCGHIIDLSEARLVEEAGAEELRRMFDEGVAGRIGGDQTPLEPALGPDCTARLINIGGGGAGLAVLPEDQSVLDTARQLWLSIDLRPQVPAPLGLVSRVRHLRSESSGMVYAGVSFETHASPRLERFVADLLCQVVADLQRRQLSQGGEASAGGG